MPLADVFDIPFQRFKARYDASPIPGFLGWWLGELRSLLPQRWQDALRAESAWVEIESIEGGVSASLFGTAIPQRHEVRVESLSDLAAAVDQALGEAAATRRVLLLPPARVLRRIISLPAAARERLHAVLGFELDRQTPFKPEQVHFDSRVLGEDVGAKQIRVELALVPREQLDTALAALGTLGTALDAVDVRGSDGHRAGFNLLPPARRLRRANFWLWTNLALIGASLLLLFLAMGQTLSNREAAIAQLDAQVEEQRSLARSVTQLRRGLDEAVEGGNFLARRRAQQPLMIDLLEELTRLLPDDTYLERLNFDGEQVTIHGLSSQASALLQSLQGSERLSDPSLSGPIQPDPRAGKDRFQITAGFGPKPQEPARATAP
jgi:general secretion pathway protein L